MQRNNKNPANRRGWVVQDHLYNVLGISLIFYAMERETDSSWAGIWIFQGGFPGGSDGKESACNAGDLDSIPGLEDPLEKVMATHSSIHGWEIPWREEPGEPQSMGWQRVEHDWANNTFSREGYLEQKSHFYFSFSLFTYVSPILWSFLLYN